MTYAKENEWLEIIEGSWVLIQGKGTEGVREGTVLSVSQVPAGDDMWLESYKILDSSKSKNPLAYYEVRILVDSGLEPIPFGTNLNAIVIVDEAQDAVSVNEVWFRNHGTKAILKRNRRLRSGN